MLCERNYLYVFILYMYVLCYIIDMFFSTWLECKWVKLQHRPSSTHSAPTLSVGFCKQHTHNLRPLWLYVLCHQLSTQHHTHTASDRDKHVCTHTRMQTHFAEWYLRNVWCMLKWWEKLQMPCQQLLHRHLCNRQKYDMNANINFSIRKITEEMKNAKMDGL